MGIKSMSNYGVAICGVIMVAVFVQSINAQTVHVVGDSTGWTVPQGGAAVYSTWASTQNFVVGDNLSMIISHIHFCFLFYIYLYALIYVFLQLNCLFYFSSLLIP